MMPRTTTAAPTATPAIVPVLRPLLEVLPAVEVELAALLLVTVTAGIDDCSAVSPAPQKELHGYILPFETLLPPPNQLLGIELECCTHSFHRSIPCLSLCSSSHC